MRATRKIIFGVLLLLGCLVVAPVSCWYLKDPERVRASFLREKPLGTSRAEIERWLAREKKLRFTKYDMGGVRQDPLPRVVVGVKHLKAMVGDYNLPLRTTLVGFWCFNERDELIEMWIWRTVDSF